MTNGVPLQKITWAGLALVALFVAAGTFLIATGHDAQGANAFGTATGIVVGTGVTTAITVNDANKNRNNGNGDGPSTP